MSTFFFLNRVRALVLTAFVLTVFASSCKKDSNIVDPQPSQSAVEGTWRISNMNVNPSINIGGKYGTVNDLLPFLIDLTGSTCLTDVKITFKGNGNISSDNPASCQTLDPEEATGIDTSGKWVLNGDKVTLTDSEGGKTVYTASFNGNTMNWSYQDQMEDETGKLKTYTITLVFKKA